MMAPMPSAISAHGPSVRLSVASPMTSPPWLTTTVSVSAPSASNCSIGLVRINDMPCSSGRE